MSNSEYMEKTENSTSNSTGNTCDEHSSDAVMTAGSVGLPFIAIAGILSNILAIAALKVAIKELRPVHRFLINLSITDILLCSSTVGITGFYIWQCNDTMYIVNAICLFLFSTCMTGQAGSLLILALDHYFAIVYPLRYQCILNKKRCYSMIGILWIGVICFQIPYTVCSFSKPPSTYAYDFDNYCEVEGIVIAAYLVICFLGMLVIYVRVLLEIQGMKSTNMSSTHRPGQSKKAIKTTLLLLGTYFLCIGPQWVATLAVPSDAQKLRSRTNAILLCILLMNCVCDPLIYSLRMRDVKQGYDKLISICKLKNAVRDQTPCDVIPYGR